MSLFAGLLMLYPVAVHLSIVAGVPLLGALSLAALPAAGYLFKRRYGIAAAWAVPALVLAMSPLWPGATDIWRVVYLPPIFVSLGLLALFVHTLRPGRTPVATVVAGLMGDELTAPVRRYTRKVTLAWAVFFALMTLETLALAVFAPLELWSLFAYVINYFLVALMFVGEYLVRLVCMKGGHPGFAAFVRAMGKVDFRALGPRR